MQDKTAKSPSICLHVIVSGRVQGVGYRVSTVYQAQKLGVSGWVHNLPDSRVEAVFEGEATAVDQMVQWCRVGPTAAVVEKIVVEQIEPQEIQGFDVRY